jgi:hypothetical protein
MPLESKMTRFNKSLTPYAWYICLVLISPSSELESMVYFIVAIGKLCFAAKLDDMEECDAP